MAITCIKKKLGSCLGCNALNEYDRRVNEIIFQNGGNELSEKELETIRSNTQIEFCPQKEKLEPNRLNDPTIFRYLSYRK